jgi:hypothetical protein
MKHAPKRDGLVRRNILAGMFALAVPTIVNAQALAPAARGVAARASNGAIPYQLTSLDLTGASDSSDAITAALTRYGWVQLPATATGQSIKANITLLSGQRLTGAGRKIWDRVSAWTGVGTLVMGSVSFKSSKGATVTDLSIDAYAAGTNAIAGANNQTIGSRVARVATRAKNHGQLWEKNSPSDKYGDVINDIIVEDCVHYGGPNGFVSKMRGVTFRRCYAYDVTVQAFVAVSDNINGATIYSRVRIQPSSIVRPFRPANRPSGSTAATPGALTTLMTSSPR